MSAQTQLGQAPGGYAHAFERPYVWVETHNSVFAIYPFHVENWRVIVGANERLPTAEIRINLTRDIDVEALSDFLTPSDWKVFDGQNYKNPEDILGGGRRVQIKTAREHSADDWCIFDGYIDRINKGWSGGSPQKPRWLVLYCTSVIAAADREASQFLFGQWRRSRKAEIALVDDPNSEDSRKCVRVTAVPAIFNPGGKGNSHYVPLEFPGHDPAPAFRVYVFNDVIQPPIANAIDWNVARILRYIQWAALQPAIPVPSDPQDPYTDQIVYSNPSGPPALQWTSVSLAYNKSVYSSASGDNENQVGPNLDELIAPYLNPGGVSGTDPQSEALMRTPASLSIDGLTVMEAFALVCHRTGILFSVEHDTNENGQVFTFLRFTVRGDRCPIGGATGATDDATIPTPDNSGLGLRLRAAGPDQTCTARGVDLYVSSDILAPPANSTIAFKRDGPTEGTIVQDVSAVRNRVLAIGEGTQYECTTSALLPGWFPDDWWDVDPQNSAAVSEAETRIPTPQWDQRYGRAAVGFQYKQVGRYWVLNEDGTYIAIAYKRDFGPWNTDAAWDIYKWFSTGGIFELVHRGDDYWSARRRQFLPLIAHETGTQQLLPPFAWLSFNGGVDWWPARACHMECDFDGDRCALTVRNPVLNHITNPNPLPAADEPRNYATAYIRGKLRIRVTANVEGDDALEAFSQAQQSTPSLPWVETLDRRRELQRKLRSKPNYPAVPACAGNPLVVNSSFSNYLVGGNLDSQVEAVRLANRMARETSIPRFSGSAVIPWLWRNNKGPVAGYRVGDEILGVKTGHVESYWSFTPGRSPNDPAPRIIGITYSYSEIEQSTSLQIEDRAFGVDDVIGSPAVADPERWRAGTRL